MGDIKRHTRAMCYTLVEAWTTKAWHAFNPRRKLLDLYEPWVGKRAPGGPKKSVVISTGIESKK